MIRYADSSKRRCVAEEIGKLGKNNISADIFTFHELSDATQNFNPEALVGEGGFGRVYKGYLETKNLVILLNSLRFDHSQAW